MGIAVGIDLGTTNSAIAYLGPSGRPEIIPNSLQRATTPSVVHFRQSGSTDVPVVGESALKLLSSAPQDTVQNVKRHMGDPSWRFDSASGSTYSPEEISALILRSLKRDAEKTLGTEVTDAVITVPAYFDDVRRTATRQAGIIAGFNVLRIVNEPTAAALAYGLDAEGPSRVLVYDLGGGTFDVTLLDVKGASFTVLGTDGDRNLGGFDFDNALMRLLAEKFAAAGLPDALEGSDREALLREQAEQAKRRLTTRDSAIVTLAHDGGSRDVVVTREEFEKVTEDLLARTVEIVEDVLGDAGCGWEDIDKTVLMGGSSRMPMVRKTLEELSGKPVSDEVNPDEAVALGAAVQARIEQRLGESQLENIRKDAAQKNLPGLPGLYGGQSISIQDVTSQPLGVIVLDPDTRRLRNSIVIPRNSPIPGSYSMPVATVEEKQQLARTRVTQGESSVLERVNVIGEALFSFPPRPKGWPLDLNYHYDIEQRIYVELIDHASQEIVGTFTVERLDNLTDDDVAQAAARIQRL